MGPPCPQLSAQSAPKSACALQQPGCGTTTPSRAGSPIQALPWGQLLQNLPALWLRATQTPASPPRASACLCRCGVPAAPVPMHCPPAFPRCRCLTQGHDHPKASPFGLAGGCHPTWHRRHLQRHQRHFPMAAGAWKGFQRGFNLPQTLLPAVNCELPGAGPPCTVCIPKAAWPPAVDALGVPRGCKR